jgi:hypothetical protein
MGDRQNLLSAVASASGCSSSGSAFHAHQSQAEKTFSPRFRGDPLADLPGRIVSHVLAVSTLEIGHPVLIFVLMKPNYLSRNSGIRSHHACTLSIPIAPFCPCPKP